MLLDKVVLTEMLQEAFSDCIINVDDDLFITVTSTDNKKTIGLNDFTALNDMLAFNVGFDLNNEIRRITAQAFTKIQKALNGEM